MSQQDNSLLGLLKKQGRGAIVHKIHPQPMIEREAQNAGTVATDRQGETPELSGRNDPREIPGFPRPGLTKAFCEMNAGILASQAGRLANRPPDAALNPVDAAFLGVEDRLRVVVDERNRLQQEVAGLYRALNLADEALDQERERTGVREVVLAAELRAETAMKRRAVYTAALLFCLLCWRDGWWIAKWIWGVL